MKNLESSIQNILNEEYIEESIDKVKDLYDNRDLIYTLQKGDRIEIAIESIKYDGKPFTNKEMFFVDAVKTMHSDMFKVELGGKAGVYTLYRTGKGMLVLTLGDKRLVISGIRKK